MKAMSFLKRLPIFLIGAFSIVLITGCSKIPVYQLSTQAGSYFEHPSALGESWESYGDGLYGFQYKLDRSLIIETDKSIIVVESFNGKMANRLMQILSNKFPNKPVSHLFYSHHHLDHTRGGFELDPVEVWAHSNTQRHFTVHNADADVLMPTHFLSGTQEIIINNRGFELVEFAHGHGEYLFGFYFPEEKLFYGPDLALCKTFFPYGFPDFNHHGHVEAMKKALELDFDTFISSHFQNGNKSCIEQNIALFEDARQAVEEGYSLFGEPAEGDDNAKWFRNVVFHTQEALEPKYSDWHGYNEMSLPFVLRQMSGAYLGF